MDVSSLRKRIDALLGAKRANQSRLDRELTKRDEAQELCSDLELVRKALGILTEKQVGEKISSINELVTYGLNTVFHDRDLRFELSIKDNTKKLTYKITTWDGLEKSADDTDGSVTVVQGFLLRLICLLELGRPKFLVMDETFAAVGVKYINNLARLLDELSTNMAVDILLISHNSGSAHRTEYKLSLDQDGGLIPEKVIRQVDRETAVHSL